MKTTEQLKPNYAPVYAAALYPDLARIFQTHGYALACHGSLARDLDLIAVPWADAVSAPEDVLEAVCAEFRIRVVGSPEARPHGRRAHTVSIGFGECCLDISFLCTESVWRDEFEALLDYSERQVCAHEHTRRLGVIWTECENCGKKWADDEGGPPTESDAPAAVVRARDFFDAMLAPKVPGDTIQPDETVHTA